MPELSASRIGYRGTGLGGGSPLITLSRNYHHSGTPVEPTPAEIVAELHKRIAAKSPEHARLVAAFHRAQEMRRLLLLGDGHENVLKTSRKWRVSEYGKLRARGVSVEAAAAAVGVSVSTAGEYGRELRRAAQDGTAS